MALGTGIVASGRLLKMEGFTNDEIARSLKRVPRSVERKLQAIRKIWKDLGE